MITLTLYRRLFCSAAHPLPGVLFWEGELGSCPVSVAALIDSLVTGRIQDDCPVLKPASPPGFVTVLDGPRAVALDSAVCSGERREAALLASSGTWSVACWVRSSLFWGLTGSFRGWESGRLSRS